MPQDMRLRHLISSALGFAPGVSEINIRTPGADVDEADMPDSIPQAFVEESCIRIAYLQAVIANIYSHVSIL